MKQLANQYEYVKDSRAVLLGYCSTISQTDFIKENSSFGRGSIRNLLVHIANTYEFWIGKFGLQGDITFTKYDSVSTIENAANLFEEVDKLMVEFLKKMESPNFKVVDYVINETKGSVEPLKLFTHVITHEFHHKGQILSLSRHLGYTPIDTDVMGR